MFLIDRHRYMSACSIHIYIHLYKVISLYQRFSETPTQGSIVCSLNCLSKEEEESKQQETMSGKDRRRPPLPTSTVSSALAPLGTPAVLDSIRLYLPSMAFFPPPGTAFSQLLLSLLSKSRL